MYIYIYIYMIQKESRMWNVYIYIYVCMYVCMHVCIYIYIHINIMRKFILLCFNVLSTVPRENRPADFLYIHIYIYLFSKILECRFYFLKKVKP